MSSESEICLAIKKIFRFHASKQQEAIDHRPARQLASERFETGSWVPPSPTCSAYAATLRLHSFGAWRGVLLRTFGKTAPAQTSHLLRHHSNNTHLGKQHVSAKWLFHIQQLQMLLFSEMNMLIHRHKFLRAILCLSTKQSSRCPCWVSKPVNWNWIEITWGQFILDSNKNHQKSFLPQVGDTSKSSNLYKLVNHNYTWNRNPTLYPSYLNLFPGWLFYLLPRRRVCRHQGQGSGWRWLHPTCSSFNVA